MSVSFILDTGARSYDQIFHDYLAQLGSYAEGLKEGLGDELDEGTWQDILATVEDAGAADAGFLWDSLFDVLLYRFGDGFARQVHEVIMEQIIATVRQYRDQGSQPSVKFSLIAHSLGTAFEQAYASSPSCLRGMQATFSASE